MLGRKENRARLFAVVFIDRTRGNRHKGKWEIPFKHNLFTVRVVKPWSRIPGEVVELPSLEIFIT